jgi:hypothetical protein
MAKWRGTGSKFSRRDFARGVAIAAATAAALPGEVLPAAETPKHAPNDQAEVESKIEAIFRRHGSRLSDAQKADIRRLVRDGQKPLDAMRAFPLDNADQPGNVLMLYPDPPGEDVAPASKQR